MKSITMNAHAKINLSLDVLYKRTDGYHELRMIMNQIDLKDIVTITKTNRTTIECNNPNVPLGSSNLAYKAWEVLSNEYGIKEGVHIKIDKNIPIAAGLAGGSADAAAVLKGLNKLWNLNLTTTDLMKLGVKIGADIPYCIMGGTALAEGIGEKLTKLTSFSGKLILLAKPDVDVSTKEVYENLLLDKIKTHPQTDMLIEYINRDNVNKLAANMVNVLETVTQKKYSEIESVKKEMIEYGALGSIMSGSGPTVFGVFENKDDIIKCKNKLKTKIKDVYIVKTI